MKNPLVDKIGEILKEKNFEIASIQLNKIAGLDKLGTENFLYNIIFERWVAVLAENSVNLSFPF